MALYVRVGNFAFQIDCEISHAKFTVSIVIIFGHFGCFCISCTQAVHTVDSGEGEGALNPGGPRHFPQRNLPP